MCTGWFGRTVLLALGDGVYTLGIMVNFMNLLLASFYSSSWVSSAALDS